jgi:hypothetical protein
MIPYNWITTRTWLDVKVNKFQLLSQVTNYIPSSIGNNLYCTLHYRRESYFVGTLFNSQKYPILGLVEPARLWLSISLRLYRPSFQRITLFIEYGTSFRLYVQYGCGLLVQFHPWISSHIWYTCVFYRRNWISLR